MIEPATVADVMELAEKLTPADVHEIKALAGMDPLEALSIGLMHSHSCMAGRAADGELACLFGVTKAAEGIGAVWLLSSPAIRRCAREVVTTGREWLDQMNAIYPVLLNVVSQENTVHLRMIKALGFQLGSPIENYNQSGVTAVPFERRHQCVHPH